MRRFSAFGLFFAVLFFLWNTVLAQDKAFEAEVLQSLKDANSRLTTIDTRLSVLENKVGALENRLNDMDKRYEVRFATIETKLEAVNQRIDDKFNLIVA